MRTWFCWVWGKMGSQVIGFRFNPLAKIMLQFHVIMFH